MNAQTRMFGKPEEAFDLGTLKSLIYKAKSITELIPAKIYLLSYFRLCSKPNGVILWRPDINTFEH